MNIAKEIVKKILIISASALIVLVTRGKGATLVRSASEITAAAQATQTTRSATNYDARLHALKINLRPGTEHRSDSDPLPEDENRCKSIVYRTLITLPRAHRTQLKYLTLYYTDDGRRGLGGNNTIILRCNNVTDKELAAVLAHEVGHLVDDTLLTGTNGQKSAFMDFDEAVLTDDPSLIFYSFSWANESTRKRTSAEEDFVSQYAMSDPFEDFSETYAFYRYHGAEFAEMAEENDVLNKKYEFMKEYVFNGKEFRTKSVLSSVALTTQSESRPFDVTILPY